MALPMSTFLPSLPVHPEAFLQSPKPEPLMATTRATTPSAFEQTTQNLLKLGSLTMDKFGLDSSAELDSFDIPLVDPANPNATGYYLGDTTATRQTGTCDGDSEEIPNVAPAEAIRYLRDTVQREFGTTSTDPLAYEFIEDPSLTRMACILTVTRPSGLSRSYRTDPVFSRKSEAKRAAATSAIKLGAVSFIKHGEGSNRGIVLAKLDASAKKTESTVVSQTKTDGANVGEGDDSNADRAASEISECCLEWRGDTVFPQWIYLADHKFPGAFGCVLKICISSRIQRTYSVLLSIDYSKKSLAKAACAQIAIEQGVLNFIKHGDGLERPLVVPFLGAEALPPRTTPVVTTLQAFHAALPKPMPDEVGTKDNGEINAVAWLTNMVQVAKGSRMTVAFHWHTDSKTGLHGCLLRLARPDAPSQSYFVESMFSKRADAKLAVCLLACSQGLGDYVRAVAAEIEARVTPAMRRRCGEQILPALGQALNRVKHGLRPAFMYDCDLATFGCTLRVDLSPESSPNPPIKKEWKVPLAYKSKADAKVAVACAAADDGILDFIRLRGNLVGDSDENVMQVEPVDQKRVADLEEGETTVDDVKKRRKKKVKKDANANRGEGGGEEGEEVETTKWKGKGNVRHVPFLETKEEASVRGRLGGATRGKKLQKYQQRHANDKGKGFNRPQSKGGFGHAGARGGSFRSGFGSGRRRSFGPPEGFPVAHPGFFTPYPPRTPYPPHPTHPPGVPPQFYPRHSYAAPHNSGLPSGAYSFEYERRDHDRDFLPAGPGPAHERRVHGLGRAGADTTTSFINAPSPAPPPVGPAYYRYHVREHDYDYARTREYYRGPHAQPPYAGVVYPSGSAVSSSVPPPLPYGYEYPSTAGDARPPLPSPHRDDAFAYQDLSTDYSYEDGEYAERPAQSIPRAYEPGHYAPDYDRILDRNAAMHDVPPVPPPAPSHAHEQVALNLAGSSTSLPQGLTPSHTPTPHTSPFCPHSAIAAVQQPSKPLDPHGYGLHGVSDAPAPSVPATVNDDDLHHNMDKLPSHGGQARPARSSAPSLHVQQHVDAPVRTSIEEALDGVISRIEKQANVNTTSRSSGARGSSNGRGKPSQPLSPTSVRKPSTQKPHASAPGQNSNVSKKRERTSDSEDNGLPSSKRARGRSGSISRPSDRKPSKGERSGMPVPSSGRSKSVAPEECERALEAMVLSPPPDLVEDGRNTKRQKQVREKSSAARQQTGGEPTDKSYVDKLFEHCVTEGISLPELYHEEVAESMDGTGKSFKIWFIMGKERLELPTAFPSLVTGQERVAKSVLGRLRLQTKKQKEV